MTEQNAHRCIIILLSVLFLGLNNVYAQTINDSLSVVVFDGMNQYGLPVNNTDSITFPSSSQPSVKIFCDSLTRELSCDSISFKPKSDTLIISYHGDDVVLNNPRLDLIDINVDSCSANVIVTAHNMPELVISTSGYSNNGSLKVLADTTYTLRLNGLILKSIQRPAFNSCLKQKVQVELVSGTENILEDDTTYVIVSDDDDANGCFNSKGHIDFYGNGTLKIVGHKKHGIYCKKGIKFKGGNLDVVSSPSDGIHSGKYIEIDSTTIRLLGQSEDGIDADEYVEIRSGIVDVTVTGDDHKAIKCAENFIMSDGRLNFNLAGKASKGVKTKKNIIISGGAIEGISSGDILMEDGDLAYSSFIKSDINTSITGGTIHLINNGTGGRCITCEGNMTINGGIINLETHGAGDKYINTEGIMDYYTPRCLAAKDSLLIYRGALTCLSTGLGGKGIVSDNYMAIGFETDTLYTEGPIVIVETTDSCIINDTDEDQRFGCPKAIKVDSILNIYGGDVHATTHGMGGEGIECNNEMYVYGGNIECNTYDDGMNIGHRLEINGGQVYCNSIDNDGIDSNGSITINGGVVASVNQKKPNESFDSEGRSLFINGGIVFGIGSAMVDMDDENCLYYNTLYNVDPDRPSSRGLLLTAGKYAYVMNGDILLMSLLTENENKRKFVTVVHPSFTEDSMFSIEEGNVPLQPTKSLFNGKFFMGGMPQEQKHVTDIYPKYNFNF